MPHRTHTSSTAARLHRLPQTLCNLGWAGLALLALPLICCALVLQLRVRTF